MLEHIVTNPSVFSPLHTFTMKAVPNAEQIYNSLEQHHLHALP